MLLVPNPTNGIASRVWLDHLVFLTAQTHVIFELLAELPDFLVILWWAGRWCRLLGESRMMGCTRDHSANANTSILVWLEGWCLGWERKKRRWTRQAIQGYRGMLPIWLGWLIEVRLRRLVRKGWEWVLIDVWLKDAHELSEVFSFMLEVKTCLRLDFQHRGCLLYSTRLLWEDNFCQALPSSVPISSPAWLRGDGLNHWVGIQTLLDAFSVLSGEISSRGALPCLLTKIFLINALLAGINRDLFMDVK
jgi:hypothetical protein